MNIVIKMRHKIGSLMMILIFILKLQIIFAQSSPPLLINDTDTPGNGNWEINIMGSLEHAVLHDDWQVPLFDINYGLGDFVQLTMGLPYAFTYNKNSQFDRGFNSVELGIKYRFWERMTFRGPSFSCYPKINLPFQSANGAEFILPLEWHNEWSSFGMTVEAGHVWTQGESGEWEAGLAAAFPFHHLELLAEWHTCIQESSLELVEPMVNIGFTWELSENVSSYYSVGKNIQSHNEETRLWSTMGIQLLL